MVVLNLTAGGAPPGTKNLPLRLLTETLFGVLKTAARWLLLTLFVCIHKSSTKYILPFFLVGCARWSRLLLWSTKKRPLLLLFRFQNPLRRLSKLFFFPKEEKTRRRCRRRWRQKKSDEKSLPPPPLPFADDDDFFYGRLALLLEDGGPFVVFAPFFAHSFSIITHKAFFVCGGSKTLSRSRNDDDDEGRTLFLLLFVSSGGKGPLPKTHT